MKQKFKIETMRKTWATPEDEERDVLFDRALFPIKNHPIIIFQDWRNGDYFFLSFKTARKGKPKHRGEIFIKGEVGNPRDRDSYLDTTQIHWANKEIFEKLHQDKFNPQKFQSVDYISEIFSPEDSVKIFDSIIKNIDEKPPFISLMKLEMNENNQIVSHLLYSNEILLKQTCDNAIKRRKMSHKIALAHQEKVKNTNILYESQIKKIGEYIYSDSCDLETQSISQTLKKEFPNVNKSEESLWRLWQGKNIDKDIIENSPFFNYFDNTQLKQWRNDNYGKDWKIIHQEYKDYLKNDILESNHKILPKKQSSGGMKM